MRACRPERHMGTSAGRDKTRALQPRITGRTRGCAWSGRGGQRGAAQDGRGTIKVLIMPFFLQLAAATYSASDALELKRKRELRGGQAEVRGYAAGGSGLHKGGAATQARPSSSARHPRGCKNRQEPARCELERAPRAVAYKTSPQAGLERAYTNLERLLEGCGLAETGEDSRGRWGLEVRGGPSAIFSLLKVFPSLTESQGMLSGALGRGRAIWTAGMCPLRERPTPPCVEIHPTDGAGTDKAASQPPGRRAGYVLLASQSPPRPVRAAMSFLKQ